jgi:hypothetical protein
MEPKETQPTLRLVNSTTIPARVQARSRHDSRLQSMTLGAAALGIAATGVFGYAAALTYSGTSTANAADQNLGDQNGTQPFTVNGGSSAGSNGGGTTRNSGGTTVTPNAGNQQPVNPPTTTRHRQHAVSGGS